MSQPGQVKIKIAKHLGKAIPPGGSFAKVDWDKADEVLTGSHNPDDYDLGSASQIAEVELREAVADGRESKARRIQRDLNSFTNARMAIRASWCPTCLNFLHNCQCEVEAPPVSIAFADRITLAIGPSKEEWKKQKRESRKEAVKLARRQRKEGKG